MPLSCSREPHWACKRSWYGVVLELMMAYAMPCCAWILTTAHVFQLSSLGFECKWRAYGARSHGPDARVAAGPHYPGQLVQRKVAAPVARGPQQHGIGLSSGGSLKRGGGTRGGTLQARGLEGGLLGGHVGGGLQLKGGGCWERPCSTDGCHAHTARWWQHGVGKHKDCMLRARSKTLAVGCCPALMARWHPAVGK